MTSSETILDQVPSVPSGAPVVTATIIAGPGEGQTISLRRAASLLGTKAGCKIVLRHPEIQRRHCVVVNTGQRVILRDLNTRGRTLHNGLKVEHEFLEDADRVKLGPWELRVDVARSEISGASDSPIIMDLEPDPTVIAIEDPTTRKITKVPREVSILGRAPGCDIQIEDREVSSVQAIVFTYLNRPVIYDLASENGTWINGRRAVFARLHDCDEIGLGSYVIKFRCNAPRPSQNGQILKPSPFGPPPDGTLSDFVDLSAETKLK